MCYEPGARPPYPPISGGAGSAEGARIELQAADGNRFAAYGARHDEPGGPGMVILPDVRGLHRFYEELAMRFAEAGVHATAFDYFGRTAEVGERDDDFDCMPHVDRTTPEGIGADVAATAAHVRSPERTGTSPRSTSGGSRMRWRRRGSATTSRRTTARRTRSSTARPRSTPRRPQTPGVGCSASSERATRQRPDVSPSGARG